MPYIGQRPSKGDENNFKILDDISSYTLTFDGSDAAVVSAANDTITSLTHRFVQGQRVTYHNGGGSDIGGLSGTAYFIIKEDHNTIKLASSASNASNGVAVNITGVGGGSSHTLNLAFDGTNTKFKATHTNGQKAKITRSAQLVISMNGVIQQPHDTATPSTGFGFDLDGTIVFSQAPISTDVFWAHVLTNNNVTFDISDNDVDNFTGNASTTAFNLSKSPPDNRNVLVTIDGVVQYPNDPDGTVRAYNVVENVLTFTTAPAAGAEIQVRHIGFAGSTSGGGGGVTNFYGRTGSVVLKNTDNIVANNATFSGNLTVNGTTTTLDTQLVEVDKIEVETTSTNVAIAVTHNGTGDLIRLYDGATQKVTVDDEGKVGLGTDAPATNLHINAAVPIIRFTDSDTGQYSDILQSGNSLYLSGDRGASGSGGIIFRTQGTDEKVRITSAGAVGINTTVDAATKLQVQTDATSTTAGGNIVARFQSNGSGRDATIQLSDNVAHSATISMLSSALVFKQSGTETFRIDSDGQIGIGNITPDTWSTGHGLTIGTSQATLWGVGDQVNLSGNAYFNSGWKAAASKAGASQIEQALGNIDFKVSGSVTADNSITWINALRITSDGKVGIGDDDPNYMLQLKGTIPAIAFEDTSGTHGFSVIEQNDDNLKIRCDAGNQSSGYNSNIRFEVDGTEKVRIKHNGYVGIGTNNPLSRLHVANATHGLLIDDLHAQGDQGIVFTINGDTNYKAAIRMTATGTSKGLRFMTGGFTNATERIKITDDGKFQMGGGSTWTYASQKFVVVEPNNALGMLLQGNNANEGVNLTLQNIVNANDAYSSLSFADDGGQIFGVVRGKVTDKNANEGELQFWTSGSQRLRINSSGVIQISQATPQVQFIDSDGTSQLTQILQSGSSFYIDVRNNTNSGELIIRGKGGGTATERLRINSAGRIKINHNQTPGQLDDTWLSIYDANSDSSAHDPAGISKNYAMIALHNYGTGSPGDVAGIAFGAASSFTYTKSSIAHERTGSYGTGDLVFLTNNDQDSTLVNSTDERMRITRAGNVGIGEASPSSDVTFTVRNDVATTSGYATMQIRNLYQGTTNQSNASGAEIEFLFKNHNASHNWWGGRILCYNSDNYNQYTSLQFHTASQGNAVERMRLAHDGDLTLYGKDNAELKLKAGTTTGNSVIAFLNSSGTTKGNIFYDTDDNFMVFKTNGTASSNERIRITSGGNVVVGGTSLGQAGSFGMEPNGHVRSILASGNAGDTLFGAISGISNGFQISIDSSNNQTYKFHNGSQDNLTLNSSGELIGQNSYRYVYPGNYADASKKARFMAPVNYASSVYWGGDNGSAVSSLSAGNDTNTGGNFGSSGGSENNLGYVDHPGLVPCSSVWRAQNNDTGSNFDGGWNKTITGLPGDDWGYLSTVMVRRVGSDTNGQFYHGCSGSHTLYQNGNDQPNPYFHSYFISTLPQDIWCLSIGVITGNGGGDNGDAGANTMVGTYRLDTGQKLNNGDWFRMKDGSTTQTHRVYLYYSTSSSAHLQFRQTGFYVMDGSEPSIAELSHGRLCFKAGTGIVPVEDA